jgi:uncharacterized protein (DUF2147 family)
MFRTFIVAAAATAAMTGAALADPIAGNWRTGSGERAAIAACGSAFCITLRSGEHSGRQIGQMTPGGGGNYSGEITVPSENKTYKGKATLAGNTLTMSGCVLGGLICRGEDWTRQ